ncbi:MAG TPA: amino acid ABC transporter permease [Lachnospiraceae bacterium]|nr:amino acid ABC transporter permease [Lachnospiraceae bacterium]
MFSWKYVVDYFPDIFAKFPVTLELVFVPFIISFLLGFAIAIARLKKIPLLEQVLAVYVSYVRCTPVITQMFVVYFGLPILMKQFGVNAYDWNPVIFVFVAYSINISAFLSETIRSSILAVPAGQMEAGYAVGMSGFQTMRDIIVPQALKISLPMLGNMFIGLFQATALAYMVNVIDMVGKARNISTSRGHLLEGYICCAIVFAIISLALEVIFKYVNKRLAFGHQNGYQRVRRRSES